MKPPETAVKLQGVRRWYDNLQDQQLFFREAV